MTAFDMRWDGVIRCELHADGWHKTAAEAEECIQSVANLPDDPQYADYVARLSPEPVEGGE